MLILFVFAICNAPSRKTTMLMPTFFKNSFYTSLYETCTGWLKLFPEQLVAEHGTGIAREEGSFTAQVFFEEEATDEHDPPFFLRRLPE